MTDTIRAAGAALPLVAFDWSRSAIDYTFDGETVAQVARFEELLALLDRPHRIVCETTVECYQPARRAEFFRSVRAAGHELLVINPRLTAHKRKRREKLEKTDENDARVIYRMATDGATHLYRPIETPDAEWVAKREAVNAAHTEARWSGVKDDWSAQAAAILGPYDELPADLRRALGDGKAYSKSVLGAVWTASLHASSRREFERLLGLYAAGYPSHLRSDIHHWGYLMRNGGLAHFDREGKLAWREYRRALRWAFAQLKAARPRPPGSALSPRRVAGNLHPAAD